MPSGILTAPCNLLCMLPISQLTTGYGSKDVERFLSDGCPCNQGGFSHCVICFLFDSVSLPMQCSGRRRRPLAWPCHCRRRCRRRCRRFLLPINPHFQHHHHHHQQEEVKCENSLSWRHRLTRVLRYGGGVQVTRAWPNRGSIVEAHEKRRCPVQVGSPTHRSTGQES